MTGDFHLSCVWTEVEYVIYQVLVIFTMTLTRDMSLRVKNEKIELKTSALYLLEANKPLFCNPLTTEDYFQEASLREKTSRILSAKSGKLLQSVLPGISLRKQTFLIAHRRWGTFRETSIPPFVGREEIRVPLKLPAWEATSGVERGETSVPE